MSALRLSTSVQVCYTPQGKGWTTIAKFVNEGDAEDFAWNVVDKCGPDLCFVRIRCGRRESLIDVADQRAKAAAKKAKGGAR